MDMTDIVNNVVAPLENMADVKEWIKSEIQRIIRRHDALLDRKIYPNGSPNQLVSMEGQLFLYHIGVLSELLTLIKEPPCPC